MALARIAALRDARMTTGLDTLGALLCAVDHVVLEGVTWVRAAMTTRQRAFALDVAAAFDEIEIFGHFAPYFASVVAAFQRELITHASLLTCSWLGLLVFEHDINHRSPRTTLAG